MHRSLARILALPVVSAAVLAGAAVAAPAALAETDTGGSASITVPQSVIAQFASAGLKESLVAPASASADKASETATVAFPVTGGDGDLRSFFGSVDLGGSIEIKSNNGNSQGHTVTLGSLQLNIRAGNISAVPEGSSTPVTLLDLAGQSIVGPGNTTQTLDTSALDLDSAGAAYLNQALQTSAFSAGEDIGSLSASWTV